GAYVQGDGLPLRDEGRVHGAPVDAVDDLAAPVVPNRGLPVPRDALRRLAGQGLDVALHALPEVPEVARGHLLDLPDRVVAIESGVPARVEHRNRDPVLHVADLGLDYEEVGLAGDQV